MKMNPEEITAIIKEQIKNYNVDLNVDDVGTVIEIGDGIAHVHGLDKAMAGELLDFGNDVYGLVLNLEQDNVGAVILGGEMFGVPGILLAIPGAAIIDRFYRENFLPMLERRRFRKDAAEMANKSGSNLDLK